MPPASPPTVDYQGLHEFRFAIRSFLAFSEDAARAAGLDPQQHQLILAIKARNSGSGLAVGEAAERLHLRHHTVVELCDRAIRNDLVTRHRDEEDRRVVRLGLTPHGEAVLRALSEHHLRELESAGPVLVQALEAVLAGGTGEAKPR